MSRQSDLDKKTKGVLVDKVIGLEDALAEATSGPITSSSLIKRKLSLANKALDTDTEIAQIKADKDEAIAKIEQDAKAREAAELKDLLKEHKAIIKDVTDAEKASISTISTLEAETNEKIEALYAKHDKVSEDLSIKEKALKDSLSNCYDEQKIAMGKAKTNHERAMEELSYNNDKARRDANTMFVDSVAEDLGLVVVPEAVLINAKTQEKLSKEELSAEVKKSVAISESKLKRDHESATKDAAHAAILEVSTWKMSAEAAAVSLAEAKKTLASQAAQLALIPTMIKEAVAAANSNVVVNQDANKK